MSPNAERLRPEAVIFDFDGVILDSAPMKTNGFLGLYGVEDPEVEARLRAIVWKNGGVSRYKTIAILERELFGRTPTQEEVDTLALRYAAVVDSRVNDCPLIAGAAELLAALNGTPCHLVSGTPHETLVGTVRAKRLGEHFHSVTGSPNVKAEVFARILETGGHDPARTLVVGDSLTELEAARANGTAFVGVARADAPNPFPPEVTTTPDLFGLAGLMELS